MLVCMIILGVSFGVNTLNDSLVSGDAGSFFSVSALQ